METKLKYRLRHAVHPENVVDWFLTTKRHWFDGSLGDNMFIGMRDDARKFLDGWIKTGVMPPDHTLLEIQTAQKFQEWLDQLWDVEQPTIVPSLPVGEGGELPADVMLVTQLREVMARGFMIGHSHGPSRDYQVQLKFPTLIDSQYCHTLLLAIADPFARKSLVEQELLRRTPAPVGHAGYSIFNDKHDCIDGIESNTAYNAAVIHSIEHDVLGPVERERYTKAPAWMRSVVTDLIRRIANLRTEVLKLKSAPVSPPTSAAPLGVTPEVAKKLLEMRELIANLPSGAEDLWHILYSIANPSFSSFTPWAELEAVANQPTSAARVCVKCLHDTGVGVDGLCRYVSEIKCRFPSPIPAEPKGYDDIVTFGRVLYDAVWHYGSDEPGERILEYFEKPHRWELEYQKWLELGGTLDKQCVDAFEDWYEHKDDPEPKEQK